LVVVVVGPPDGGAGREPSGAPDDGSLPHAAIEIARREASAAGFTPNGFAMMFPAADKSTQRARSDVRDRTSLGTVIWVDIARESRPLTIHSPP
jgi:hypothetical protein